MVKTLTTEAVELAHKPVEWGTALGTLAVDAIDRAIPEKTPYSTFDCPCRKSLVHNLTYLDAFCSSMPKVSEAGFNAFKSFSDQMAYHYDPTKIGAVLVSAIEGFVMGYAQGIINSTGNILDGYVDGMTFLGSGCKFDPNKKLVSDETL